jgi:hypothetical protein
MLIDRQSNQGLDAGEEDRSLLQAVLAVQ